MIWWRWYIRKINLVAKHPVDWEAKDDLLLQNKKWLSNSQKTVKGHLDHSNSVSAFSSSTLNHFWRPLKYSRIHPFPCAVSSDLPRCRITYSQHFHIGLLQWVLFQYSLASRKTFAIIFERKGSQPRSF